MDGCGNMDIDRWIVIAKLALQMMMIYDDDDDNDDNDSDGDDSDDNESDDGDDDDDDDDDYDNLGPIHCLYRCGERDGHHFG